MAIADSRAVLVKRVQGWLVTSVVAGLMLSCLGVVANEPGDPPRDASSMDASFRAAPIGVGSDGASRDGGRGHDASQGRDAAQGTNDASTTGPAPEAGSAGGSWGDASPLPIAVLASGGFDAGALVTWIWNGQAWSELAGSRPSPRYWAVLAPLGGSVVLFGGDDKPNILSDTWVLRGAGWTALAVPGPPARANAAMAPLGSSLVLFGGQGATVYRLADTWTWNGAGWKELNVSGPSPRAGAGMAPLGGKLVLFGGMDGSENVLSDTWTWDGSTWTALAAIGPPARQQALMATLGGAIVLFGGNDIGAPGGSTTYADTWTFDGSTWTEVASTGPALQAMASVSGPAVLAVDQAGGTWTFDGMTWTSLSVATLPGVFAPLLSAP